eukprot:CAMPEP_0168313200 /NCGR_PEP_ID=MMETSP0210-20121227/369_1 /TAXON_ID=40633 /ORGANISM="Condylostoma magnum, Strain COL2" /LENGTH=63 /DNA_ID=CAMNT_0008266851 /DNA_START=318 /DNA_END=509 /DNA_ORIENTATION=-
MKACLLILALGSTKPGQINSANPRIKAITYHIGIEITLQLVSRSLSISSPDKTKKVIKPKPIL